MRARRLGGGGDRLQRGARGDALGARRGGLGPGLFDRRPGKRRAHVRTERPRVGLHRGELVPTRAADHGRDVRAVAGEADLERALRGQGRGGRAGPGGRHDVGERRDLGAFGDYTRFVSPIIGLVWIVVFSGVLLARRSPSTTPQAPEPPAASAPAP